MKKHKNLFVAELMKYMREIKSYMFNTIVGLIITFIIFLAMFYGLKFYAESALTGDKLDSLVIGYIMWMFAVSGFQSLSNFISEEMQRGTLEQLYLSPLGIEKCLFVRLGCDLLYSTLFNIVLLFLTMLTTQRWLEIDVIRVLPVLLIALPSIWGIGIIFAGLTMLYKKVVSLMTVMPFALIGIISIPAYPLNAGSFLPFAAGASTIQLVIRKGQSYPLWWYLFIGAISIMYVALGVMIFKFCENIARRRNCLVQY